MQRMKNTRATVVGLLPPKETETVQLDFPCGPNETPIVATAKPGQVIVRIEPGRRSFEIINTTDHIVGYATRIMSHDAIVTISKPADLIKRWFGDDLAKKIGEKAKAIIDRIVKAEEQKEIEKK